MDGQGSVDARPRHVSAGVAEADGSDPRLRLLVQSARDGDAEAFGAIFDEFHMHVYRYIAARVRSPADAEDLAAETFAAAFGAIARFRWQGVPFEAWLFRIARSKVVDHHRSTGRHSTDPLSGSELEQGPGADPTTAIVHDEERSQLLTAMRRLSPDQQEVLALRFFADLSVSDVARAMDRSLGSVRQLQLRALTALRQRMEWLP